jgi:hypothetical protein
MLNRKLKVLARRVFRKNTTGQSIVILAIAIMALAALAGIVTDVGLLFVRYASLRRAVDAASIAAATQVREGRDYGDIVSAAREFIALHGIEIASVIVETCETNPTDQQLCRVSGEYVEGKTNRKLVRVIAQLDAPTTFLSLFGWHNVRLEAFSTSETAVMDVALVLDTSESMGFDTTQAHYTSSPIDLNAPPAKCFERTIAGEGEYWLIDGHCCNDPSDGSVDLGGNIVGYSKNPNPDEDFSDLVCMPFKNVRDAARDFLQRLDFVRGDRVVFVTYDVWANVISPGDLDGFTGEPQQMITDEATAIRMLNELIGIYGDDYEPGYYDWRTECLPCVQDASRDYNPCANCPSTNLGGGIRRANGALTDPSTIRREAVWVMIVLTDGIANRTNPPGWELGIEIPSFKYGFCPPSTFEDNDLGDTDDEIWLYRQFCYDLDPFSRHLCHDPLAAGDPTICDPNYDAHDYVMDQADLAGLSTDQGGNFVTMFSIGFGDDPQAGVYDEYGAYGLGEQLMRYISDAGDDGNIDNEAQEALLHGATDGLPDPCSEWDNGSGQWVPLPLGEDCGQYYAVADAADPNQLRDVFRDIASRLFTRITR